MGKPLLSISLLATLCVLFSALTVPQVLAHPGAAGLDFEMCLRLYLAAAVAMMLISTGLWRWPTYTAFHRKQWAAFAVGFAILLVIFVFDTGNRVMDEYSWIRYSTAAALGLAGSFALRGVQQSRARGATWRQSFVFLVLGVGFIFGGLDELLKIHEKFSGLLTFTDHRSLMNDLVSVVYALIGMGVLAALWFWFIRPQREAARISSSGEARFVLGARELHGYVLAVMVFGISQVLDTIDRPVLSLMREGAGALAGAGHRFPEFWYIAYDPRHLFNSVEEILEYGAAILFFVVTWSAIRGRDDEQSRDTIDSVASRWWRRGRLLFVAVALLFLVRGWPMATDGSPLPGHDATIASSASRAADFESLESGGRLIPGVRSVATTSGVELSVDGADLVRTRGGAVQRMATRRMFRDLRGAGVDPGGGLSFVTSSASGSFLPHILWRLPAVASEPSPAAEGVVASAGWREE